MSVNTSNPHTDTAFSLGKSGRVLLGVFGLVGLAASLSGIFVGVYLVKLTNELMSVVRFHASSYASWMLFFLLAGWLCKRMDRRIGLLMGCLAHLIFYVLVLTLGERSSEWIPLLGFLLGAANGLYWMSANVLTVDVTTPQSRSWFNGASGIISSTVAMAGPPIAAAVITIMPDNFGYTTIFAASATLFLAAIALALLLPRHNQRGTLQFSVIKSIQQIAEWRKLTYSFTALHFRDDVISFLLWIWLFAVLRNEAAIGRGAFLLTLCSAAAFFLIGRFGGRANAMKLMTAGAVAYSAAIGLFLIQVNELSMYLFAIIAGLGAPLFLVPYTTLLQNQIANYDQGGEHRIELIIARELAISVGRFGGVIVLLLIYAGTGDEQRATEVFLPLLIIAGLLPLYFVRKLQ